MDGLGLEHLQVGQLVGRAGHGLSRLNPTCLVSNSTLVSKRHAPGRPDDHALAARLATDAGRLLVDLRDKLSAEGIAGKPLGARATPGPTTCWWAAWPSLRPGDAVLSEEGLADPARLTAERVWIVDPLDGTREYGEVPRTDWAVHVALVIGGEPVAGAVALPGRDLTLATDPPPPLAGRGTGRPGSWSAAAARRRRPPGWPRPSAASWCRWARPGPRRWRWCWARPRSTPTAAASTSGTRPPRWRWRRPPGCTVPPGRLAPGVQPARPLPARPARLPAELAERVIAAAAG